MILHSSISSLMFFQPSKYITFEYILKLIELMVSLFSEYELFAFISHMGTSTMCGHYVSHIKKDQQ